MKLALAARKFFTFYKVCFGRTGTYISMLMLATVLFKQFKIPIRYYPVGFALIWLIVGIVGYLDNKLGLHQEELRITTGRNPIHRETHKRLDKIEKQLNKMAENNGNSENH